jgi:hypothetical protein
MDDDWYRPIVQLRQSFESPFGPMPSTLNNLFMLALVNGVIGDQRCPTQLKLVRTAIIAGIHQAMSGLATQVDWPSVMRANDFRRPTTSHELERPLLARDNPAHIDFLDLVQLLLDYVPFRASDGLDSYGGQESDFEQQWTGEGVRSGYPDTVGYFQCHIRRRVLDNGRVALKVLPLHVGQSIKWSAGPIANHLTSALAFAEARERQEEQERFGY